MSPLQDLPEDPFQRLVISVFRLNGALIAAGDRLVADLGLTSARWQVLGSAAKAASPLTVASIARNMGLTRQTVHTAIKELEAAGFVTLVPNPHHQRAQLVVPTSMGERAIAAAMQRQAVWARDLAADLAAKRISEASDVLQTILMQLSEAAAPDAA